MKKILIFSFIVLVFHMSANAQMKGLSAQASHSVSCSISNLLYFSLESNDKSDVNAARELVVNSSIPMTITVKEISSEVQQTYIPNIPYEETRGPAISQMIDVRNIRYYTDGNPFYATSLLYTAAPI
jgi:hypothetical protein